MQREFWNDTGRMSDGGEMSGTLLGTPTARMTQRSKRGIRKSGTPAQIAAGTRSISSVVASPASLFQWLEPDEGTVMTAGCGRLFAAFLESSRHDTCWRKMCRDSCQQMLDGSLETYSGTWPRSGTMRNGKCYRLPRLVRRISGKESSLLPTPYGLSANQGQGDGEFGKAIRLLPTPRATEAEKSPQGHRGNIDTLTAAAKLTQPGGQLNPQFVEAMMGLPLSWTALQDCDASATQ